MSQEAHNDTTRRERYLDQGALNVVQHHFEHAARESTPQAGYASATQLLLTAVLAYQQGEHQDAQQLSQAAAQVMLRLDPGTENALDLNWLITQLQNDAICYGWPGTARVQLQAAAALTDSLARQPAPTDDRNHQAQPHPRP